MNVFELTEEAKVKKMATPIGGGGGGRRMRNQQSYNNRPFNNDYNDHGRSSYQPPHHDDSNYDRDDMDDGNSLNKRLHKKPEQQYYVPKKQAPAHGGAPPIQDDHQSFHKKRGGQNNNRGHSDDFGNRNRKHYQPPVDTAGQQNEFRGNSEPRIVADNQWNYGYGQRGDLNDLQRQRDTRSVEPHLLREKKPPSGVIGGMGSGGPNGGGNNSGGRRNSTNGDNPMAQQHNGNSGNRFSNLPPRLMKKYMAENKIQDDNHSSYNNHQQHKQQPNWSQTLPRNHGGGRGRGRISNSRPETPVDTYRPRSRSSDIGNDDDDFYDRSYNSNNYHYGGGPSQHHQQNRGDYRSKDFRSSNRSLTYDDGYSQSSENYNNYGRYNNDFNHYRQQNQSSYNNYHNDRSNYKNNNPKKRYDQTSGGSGGGGLANKMYDDHRKSYNADQQQTQQHQPQQFGQFSKTSINDRLSNRAQYHSTEDMLKGAPDDDLAKAVTTKMTLINSPDKPEGKLNWSTEVEQAQQELERLYRTDKTTKNYAEDQYNPNAQLPRRRHRR